MQQNQFHLESCYLQILKQNKKSLVIFFNRQKKKGKIFMFSRSLNYGISFLVTQRRIDYSGQNLIRKLDKRFYPNKRISLRILQHIKYIIKCSTEQNFS